MAECLERRTRAERDVPLRRTSRSPTVELSKVAEPLVQMDDVSHVTMQGLVVEMGAGEGIVINGGDHCLVAGCVVRRLGRRALPSAAATTTAC